MAVPTPEATGELARVVTSEAGYGLRFLRRHGWRVLLIFVGVLLPMLVFAALVDELRESEVFFFDAPILLAVHGMATPAMDRFAVLMSKLGYLWGVVPLDIGIFAWLAWRRRFRDGLFFGLAVLGSMTLDLVAKFHFARVRPSLWLSLAPENTFSFPSGHAMGSATLAVALILLVWPTRWGWLTLIGSSLFVVLVGLSRVYLGVHYPSDILAGWMAGTAWVVAIYQLVAHRAPRPPPTA
jgi:undecaprenyl-diphosphatase